MMYGDISNHRSFCIGFRCENTLLLPKKGLLANATSLVLNKWTHSDIDKRVLAVMKDLYWNTDCTVALVVEAKTYANKAFRKYIEDFPINTIMNVIDNFSEISMWLNTGELSYLVVNDIIEKSMINSAFAMSLYDFCKAYKVKSKGRLHR